MKSIVRPLRTDIPIYLGAEGPKNVALAAEICDGWLPMFFSPKADGFYREALAEGFARPGARQTPDTFEVACVVPMIVGEDLEACADLMRPTLALYVGGMGAKDRNFHRDVFARLGYEDACDKIQEAYLAGHLGNRALSIETVIERYEAFMYQQWLRVYMRTQMIKHNKDVLESVGDDMALLAKLHVF